MELALMMTKWEWVLVLLITPYSGQQTMDFTHYRFYSAAECEEYSTRKDNASLNNYIVENYRDQGVIQVTPGCYKKAIEQI